MEEIGNRVGRSGAVWASVLSSGEKMAALALMHQGGEGDASTVAEMCSVSDRTARTWLHELESQGVVFRKYKCPTPQEIKQCLLKMKTAQSLSTPSSKTCDWCGDKNLVLHSHHFPVRRDDGGTSAVDICPNCHAEYHHIESGGPYCLDSNCSKKIAEVTA